MRLLPLMLLVVCCSASAEWQKVGETDDAYFYVDTDTIRRQGNIRRFWSLKNFFYVGKNGVLSRKEFEEINCKEEQYKYLEISNHSEHWAEGKVLDIFSYKDSEWIRIPPKTTIEIVLKFVCKK